MEDMRLNGRGKGGAEVGGGERGGGGSYSRSYNELHENP